MWLGFLPEAIEVGRQKMNWSPRQIDVRPLMQSGRSLTEKGRQSKCIILYIAVSEPNPFLSSTHIAKFLTSTCIYFRGLTINSTVTLVKSLLITFYSLRQSLLSVRPSQRRFCNFVSKRLCLLDFGLVV